MIQGCAVYRKLVALSVGVRACPTATGHAKLNGVHSRNSIGADYIEWLLNPAENAAQAPAQKRRPALNAERRTRPKTKARHRTRPKT
jgi:hypothetical protein